MNKALNKIFFSTLMTLVLSGAVFAIDAEYKNSLSKIELSKVSADTYTINLYTQKKFIDPVKIIKKNDLNYYILLPETKNTAAKVDVELPEIRNVFTNSYPYAGQDVNNGYTKINITTTKPINFNINIKNSSKQVSTVLPPLPSAKVASNTLKTDVSVQKKNIDSTPSQKQTLNAAKQTQQNLISKKTEDIKKKFENKQADNQPQPKSLAVKPVLKTDADNIIKDDIIEQNENDSDNLIENEVQETLTKEDLAQEDDFIFDNEKDNQSPFNYEEKTDYVALFKTKLISFKNKLTQKLALYGLSLKDILFMFGAGFVVFVLVLALLMKKRQPPLRLKPKSDLFTKPKQEIKKQPKSGEYFIFDKDVRQTGFVDPSITAIKRNYELSSYDPELKNYNTQKKPRFNMTNKESEYDIIQKILREDNQIKVSPCEYDVIKNKRGSKKHNKSNEILTKQMIEEDIELKEDITTSPIQKEEAKIELQKEPIVLSKVEIAPEHGFMCVSYDDNISLVGYIYDDVFALYNFKCSKLENYDIKFRLSDKDEIGANFIVKVDKTKALIRVTKSSMNLQVVM